MFTYFVECAGCKATEKVSMAWEDRALVVPDGWSEKKSVKGVSVTSTFICPKCQED